jgi:Concanavalin A-like lectin/glucanases superfamily
VPDDVVGDFDLLRKGLSSTNGGYYKAELHPNSANTKARALCQAQGSSGAAMLVGSTNLADGVWHVITCEKQAGVFNLRVDGALIASKSVTIGSISNGVPLTLGAKSTGGDWYKGSMRMAKLVVG